MSSVQMRLVAGYLRLTSKSKMATASRTDRLMARPRRAGAPPARLRRRHDVAQRQVDGFAVWSVLPHTGSTPREVGSGGGGGVPQTVLYLHGGAYIGAMARQHWAFVSQLADAGVRVEVPDYGLAPQHTHRDAYPLIGEVYRQLLTEVDAAGLTLIGDSAGAGLALGFAQTLATAGPPQPRRLVLIAPWLDLTLTNPAIPAVAARDPWLSRPGLLRAGQAWAGGDDPTDPRLSPINGSLADLAPIELYTGTRDLFHPDALLLRDRAAAEGHELQLHVSAGGIHVYPLTPTPEGSRARTQILETVTR